MKRYALAIGAGIAAVGAVAASAATLGTLTAGSLGTSTASVSGCQSSAMAVVWNAPTYHVPNSYTVDGLSLTGLQSTCESHSYSLTVADNTGAALASGTGTTPASSASPFNVTLSAPVDSAQVYNVTLTIYG